VAVTASTGEVEPAANLDIVAHRSARPLSLRANFAWTLLGNSVYAACQWGVLVALAKLGSVEIVGRFALALALTAPVLMLLNLQLRTIQATDATAEFSLGEYLTLRLVTTGLALLVIVALALAWASDLRVAGVILLVGFAKCVESVSDVLYGTLQQRERMNLLGISLTLKGILSLAAVALGLYLTGDLLWSCASMALSWLLVLVAFDLPNAAYVLRSAKVRDADFPIDASRYHVIRPEWSSAKLVSLTRLAVPLGIVMMLISLNVNIPRFFIEHLLGTRELGFFAAIAYLVVGGTTIINALGTAVSPRLSRFFSMGETGRFASMLARSTGIGMFLGVAGVGVSLLGGPQILRFLYNNEYAGYSEVLVWMMVAATVSYVASMLGFGMTAARSFKAQAPLFAVVTATTIAGSALLIPSYHLVGAAYALGAASMLQLAGSLWVILRALRRRRARWAE
jgi:O-antigen/teichoic acid export membrane protein